jgi:hypothetical protein
MNKHYTTSYWNNLGRFRTTDENLRPLIPAAGKCQKEQPKLELLRKATNCYYDLFNNGLCNRAREFRQVFGFSPKTRYGTAEVGGIQFDNEEMNLRLNLTMDRVILDAAFENGVAVVEDSQEPPAIPVPPSKVHEIRHAMANLEEAMERFSGLLDGTAPHQQATLNSIKAMNNRFAALVEEID